MSAPWWFEQVPVFARADLAGHDLGLDVAEDQIGDADVVLHDPPDRLVEPSPFMELEERQPEALLVDLGRSDRVAAGDDPPDVDVVGDRRRPAARPVVDEDRLRDVDVGKVLPRRGVRVVSDEHVAGVDPSLVLAQQVLHGVVEAAEVQGGRQALRQRHSSRVANGRRVVHGSRGRSPSRRCA